MRIEREFLGFCWMGDWSFFWLLLRDTTTRMHWLFGVLKALMMFGSLCLTNMYRSVQYTLYMHT